MNLVSHAAISPDSLSAIVAVLGAVAVKLFEKYVSHQVATQNDQLREEIRKELSVARAERDAIRHELEAWQNKYWQSKLDNSDVEEQKFDMLNLNMENLQHKMDEILDDVDHNKLTDDPTDKHST